MCYVKWILYADIWNMQRIFLARRTIKGIELIARELEIIYLVRKKTRGVGLVMSIAVL